MTGALLFVADVPEIFENEGVFHVTMSSGSESTTYVMSAHTMTRTVRAVNCALDAFYEWQQEVVMPMKRWRKR